MGVIHLPARHRSHRWLIACLVGVVLISAWIGRALLYESWTLASLPAFWWSGSDRFLLSAPGSDFDVSFANYSITQTSAAPFEDRVPPILHHVAMGGAGAAARIEQWKEVRQSCLDIHPGWEAHIWTDEKANAFVAEQFPELREMWESYQFPIQRIDALRYMVLYHYGGELCLPLAAPSPGPGAASQQPLLTVFPGVILDMDLQCRRALGPLRRFDFVAPAAHPTGFSVGFMMASQRNPFVGALVRNLRPYNRAWLGLPYPTVMFSTGCHYAS